MTRVMIASPTPGSVKTAYMKWVMAMMNTLAKAGIYAEFQTFDGISDLVVARNTLATQFLQRSDLTHLFMADADMAGPSDVIERMIICDKPVLGTGSSKRQIDLTRMDVALRRGCSLSEAILIACDWPAMFSPGLQRIELENGVLRVERHGFGAVLIQRAALEKMVATQAAPPQKPAHGENKSPFYNFFTPRPATVSQQISEDAAFCERWVKDCNGQLWVYAEPPIYHIGDFAYGGSMLQYLHAMQKMTAPTGTRSSHDLSGTDK